MSFLGVIVSLITAIWAIIKFGIKRKDDQLERNNQVLQKINARLDSIEQENLRQAKQIEDNEKSRLRQEIMSFGRELRSGYAEMTARDFEHICHVFDKYSALGGNSYARAEFHFIEEVKHQFDMAQTGEDNNNE